MVKFEFDGAATKYTDEYIISDYNYSTTSITKNTGTDGEIIYKVNPISTKMKFKTARKVPKIGLMLVGLGGNNGSTLTGVLLANKHKLSWNTKDGTMYPNYYGSLVQASTMCLGLVSGEEGTKKVCAPMCTILPFVNPDDIEIDGWDISNLDLAKSMVRARVLDYDLQQKLYPFMEGIKPRPSVFNLDYVATNQNDRANNVVHGSLWEQLNKIRSDIKDFKNKKSLDKVIVMWTASTERFTILNKESHSSAESLMQAIENDRKQDVSPSTLFAVASILERCFFINGAPQNTLYEAVQELATKNNVFICGDDFKTGQTKVKSALVEFLLGAGIKPMSVVSYNHLGNNDGKNLDSYKQFRSKEISKSHVIDEMVESNTVLYKKGEKPDHCIVIKYIPHVGDSKRAMDEYVSEICMHGKNTLVIHNTCEDSLLAATVMLDLVLLGELFTRITVQMESAPEESFRSFQSVLSGLSFLLKAPLIGKNEPLINGLAAQKACIENIARACLGIPPENNMYLESKFNIH